MARHNFLILGGAASAVMSLVDPKNHVSTQIQTVTIEELQSIPFVVDSSEVSGDNATQVVEPALLYRRVLSEQPC